MFNGTFSRSRSFPIDYLSAADKQIVIQTIHITHSSVESDLFFQAPSIHGARAGLFK